MSSTLAGKGVFPREVVVSELRVGLCPRPDRWGGFGDLLWTRLVLYSQIRELYFVGGVVCEFQVVGREFGRGFV